MGKINELPPEKGGGREGGRFPEKLNNFCRKSISVSGNPGEETAD